MSVIGENATLSVTDLVLGGPFVAEDTSDSELLDPDNVFRNNFHIAP
jgi:hypothetical protein